MPRKGTQFLTLVKNRLNPESNGFEIWRITWNPMLPRVWKFLETWCCTRVSEDLLNFRNPNTMRFSKLLRMMPRITRRTANLNLSQNLMQSGHQNYKNFGIDILKNNNNYNKETNGTNFYSKSHNVHFRHCLFSWIPCMGFILQLRW